MESFFDWWSRCLHNLTMVSPRKVNILGLGYLGLAMALHLTKAGHEVCGWDVDEERRKRLRKGVLPYEDADLLSAWKELLGKDSICVADQEALPSDADLWLVTVGTPVGNNGLYDLSSVRQSLSEIERITSASERHPLVLVRSTLPPGATAELQRAHPSLQLFYWPEFLREGQALRDLARPSLSLLGFVGKCPDQRFLLRIFPDAAPRFVPAEIAEMVKCASNTFHALKVSFANEIGSLCSLLGVDGSQVMEIFCDDRELNLSSAYLRPAFAFGGPCLGKDVRALSSLASQKGLRLPLIAQIEAANGEHIERAVRWIGRQTEKRILITGSGFKEESVDTRFSPVRRLADRLLEENPLRPILFYEGSALESAASLSEALRDPETLVVLGPLGLQPGERLEIFTKARKILDLYGRREPQLPSTMTGTLHYLHA